MCVWLLVLEFESLRKVYVIWCSFIRLLVFARHTKHMEISATFAKKNSPPRAQLACARRTFTRVAVRDSARLRAKFCPEAGPIDGCVRSLVRVHARKQPTVPRVMKSCPNLSLSRSHIESVRNAGHLKITICGAKP